MLHYQDASGKTMLSVKYIPFFLVWTRSSCLQESPMAQSEAQDVFIFIIAYIK